MFGVVTITTYEDYYKCAICLLYYFGIVYIDLIVMLLLINLPLHYSTIIHTNFFSHKILTFFFLSGFSFTYIHYSQDSKEGGWVYFELYHFHPFHRHLDISRAITKESSPLHIASNRTQTKNLWFPSASH